MREIIDFGITGDHVKPGTDRRRLLFRILTGRQSLKSDELRTAQFQALMEDDREFSRMVYDVKDSGEFHEETMTPLERFFLSHWDTPRDGIPALHHFDSRNLDLICRYVLKRPPSEPGTMEKFRQRLALPICLLERKEFKLRKDGFEILRAERRRD